MPVSPTADVVSILKVYAPFSTALAALAVAGFHYITMRRKNYIETLKTELEIDKIKMEIEVLDKSSETNSENISEIQNVLIEQLPMYHDEKIVYANKTGNIGFDFSGYGRKIHVNGKAVSEDGSGSISFIENEIISVVRNKVGGKYSVSLKTYNIDGQTKEFIPANMLDDRSRRIRVSCEARILDKEHSIRLLVQDMQSFQWVGKSVVHRISSNEWRRIEGYFYIPPHVKAIIRIDDEEVDTAPSTVQLRRVMVTQRTAE